MATSVKVLTPKAITLLSTIWRKPNTMSPIEPCLAAMAWKLLLPYKGKTPRGNDFPAGINDQRQ